MSLTMRHGSLWSQMKKRLGKNHRHAQETVIKNYGNIKRLLEIIYLLFGLELLLNIKQKHLMGALVHVQANGAGGKRAKKLSETTMAAYATAARIAAETIGKRNIVPETNEELKTMFGIYAVRAGERLKPKPCLSEAQANIRELLYATGEWLGLAHDMREAFGLRARESLGSNQVVTGPDGQPHLQVTWTKGGHDRLVPIVTEAQRLALTRVQGHLRSTGGASLIPRDLSKKQGIRHQKDALHRLGATKDNGTNAHTLRHGYAQDRAADGVSRGQIAKELGHGREQVVSHYLPAAAPARASEG